MGERRGSCQLMGYSRKLSEDEEVGSVLKEKARARLEPLGQVQETMNRWSEPRWPEENPEGSESRNLKYKSSRKLK